MSNFFLGPNFSEKLAMGVTNPIKLNVEELQTNQELEQEQVIQELETEKPEQKKLKSEKNGKES
jgi:hypothetical protein